MPIIECTFHGTGSDYEMPATSTATPAETATATETISGNKWRTSGIKAKGGTDTDRVRERGVRVRVSEKREERELLKAKG